MKTERHIVQEWIRQGLPQSREGRPRDGYVFLQFTRGDQHKYHVLKEGYGMMVFCEGCSPERKYPIPRFRLFAHDRGIVVETRDIAELKRALSLIPAGETVRLIDTCCGGTHSGIDPNVLEEIEDFCRQQRIIYSDDDEGVICTCV